MQKVKLKIDVEKYFVKFEVELYKDGSLQNLWILITAYKN